MHHTDLVTPGQRLGSSRERRAGGDRGGAHSEQGSVTAHERGSATAMIIGGAWNLAMVEP
jgi:hypothetical protein